MSQIRNLIVVCSFIYLLLDISFDFRLNDTCEDMYEVLINYFLKWGHYIQVFPFDRCDNSTQNERLASHITSCKVTDLKSTWKET